MPIQHWKSILECRAFDELEKLSSKACDLTAEGVLNSSRFERYVCQGPLFDLLYPCQRVDAEVLSALQSLADECGLIEQFVQMRAGAVMNRIEGYPSEERQVLHTACRDFFSDSPASVEATSNAKIELEKLRTFLSQLKDGTICNAEGEAFTSLVQIGIGGSDLGPRAMYEALRAYTEPDREVFFISNVDPDDCAAVLEKVDLTRALILVVSKSGTTLETHTNEKRVRVALKSQGLDPSRHCVAVTGVSSPMDDPDRYLRTFYMYDYIGGRFSSTSMVGAVMLGFALGYDLLLEFLEGAALMDVAAEQRNIRENLPLLLALFGVWNHNFLGMETLAVLPYSQPLHRFPAHLQQCDMESNGKSVQRSAGRVQLKTGPVVWGEPGTNGQHAFYQLLHQGTEYVAVEFIGFRRSQRNVDVEVEGSTSQQKLLANLLAQSVALATGRKDSNPNRNFDGNRVSVILMADRLTPKSMGALLSLYEAKIVYQGFCWNINSFDQEGVQLGKLLSTKFLSVMKQKGTIGTLAGDFLAAAGLK